VRKPLNVYCISLWSQRSRAPFLAPPLEADKRTACGPRGRRRRGRDHTERLRLWRLSRVRSAAATQSGGARSGFRVNAAANRAKAPALDQSGKPAGNLGRRRRSGAPAGAALDRNAEIRAPARRASGASTRPWRLPRRGGISARQGRRRQRAPATSPGRATRSRTSER
jgi:hypothetical protein